MRIRELPSGVTVTFFLLLSNKRNITHTVLSIILLLVQTVDYGLWPFSSPMAYNKLLTSKLNKTKPTMAASHHRYEQKHTLRNIEQWNIHRESKNSGVGIIIAIARTYQVNTKMRPVRGYGRAAVGQRVIHYPGNFFLPYTMYTGTRTRKITAYVHATFVQLKLVLSVLIIVCICATA